MLTLNTNFNISATQIMADFLSELLRGLFGVCSVEQLIIESCCHHNFNSNFTLLSLEGFFPK